jgi:hypothetical protein
MSVHIYIKETYPSVKCTQMSVHIYIKETYLISTFFFIGYNLDAHNSYTPHSYHTHWKRTVPPNAHAYVYPKISKKKSLKKVQSPGCSNHGIVLPLTTCSFAYTISTWNIKGLDMGLKPTTTGLYKAGGSRGHASWRLEQPQHLAGCLIIQSTLRQQHVYFLGSQKKCTFRRETKLLKFD